MLAYCFGYQGPCAAADVFGVDLDAHVGEFSKTGFLTEGKNRVGIDSMRCGVEASILQASQSESAM